MKDNFTSKVILKVVIESKLFVFKTKNKQYIAK